MRDFSTDRAGAPDFADGLALTSADRRLESMVLLQLLRSAEDGPDAGPREEGPAHSEDRDVAGPVQGSIGERALRIASYLSREYGLRTLEQKMLVSDLAVEIAQRIQEELDGHADSRRA